MFDQYMNPYGYPQRPMSQMPPKYEVVRVNGRGGADAFQMAPNSDALLLDTSAPIVWLKTTDGAGYATCTPYTITPEEKWNVSHHGYVEKAAWIKTMLQM